MNTRIILQFTFSVKLACPQSWWAEWRCPEEEDEGAVHSLSVDDLAFSWVSAYFEAPDGRRPLSYNCLNLLLPSISYAVLISWNLSELFCWVNQENKSLYNCQVIRTQNCNYDSDKNVLLPYPDEKPLTFYNMHFLYPFEKLWGLVLRHHSNFYAHPDRVAPANMK